MEQQQPNESLAKSKRFWTTLTLIIAIVVIAIIGAGVVFIMQQSKTNEVIKNFEFQKNDLQNKITQSELENQELKKQIIGLQKQIHIQNLTTSTQPITEATGTWKKFESKKYNFEIQYPEKTDYEIKYYSGDKTINKITRVSSNTYATNPEEADSIAIGWGPNSFFEVDFLANTNKLSLQDFIKNSVDNKNPNNNLTYSSIQRDGQKILFNGKEAFKFKTGSCCIADYKLIQGNQIFYYFVYDDSTIGRITYHLTNPLDDHAVEHEILFEKMFDTFKFKS